MYRDIMSAKYVKYNANNAGNNSGDCVKRAISLAYDISYNEVSKMLRSVAKEAHMNWTIPIVYRTVIRQLDPDFKPKLVQDDITLSDFVDENCQSGTWLVETGRRTSKSSNHIVCIVDGSIYDSWDSSDEYVKNYGRVNISERRAFTDLDKHLPELGLEFEDELLSQIQRNILKYQATQEWAQNVDNVTVLDSLIKGYQIVTKVKLILGPTSYRSRCTYLLTITGVLHPQDTLEEAEHILAETAKVRCYDRLYEINRKEKDRKETFEEEQAAGSTEMKTSFFGSQRSISFYKSMPPWAKAICSEVWVQQPGRYTDSYMVTLIDPATREKLEFYAPNADGIRMELAEYKKNGSIPGRDYDAMDLIGW